MIPVLSVALLCFGFYSRLTGNSRGPSWTRDSSSTRIWRSRLRRYKFQKPGVMSIERDFDVSMVAGLALREKQIRQNYRVIIGVQKWFARRPGTLFRGLLLVEFGDRKLL